MSSELDTVYNDLQRKHDSKSARSSRRAVSAGALQTTGNNDGLMKDKLNEQESNHPVFCDTNPAKTELDNLSNDLRRKHDSKARSSVSTAGATRVDGPESLLMNEHDKMQLAMQTSEATMPGAVHYAPGQAPVRAQPSQFSQLNLFARIRRYAMNDGGGPTTRHKHDNEARMIDQTGISNSAMGQEPLDGLRSSMNMCQRQHESMEDSHRNTKRWQTMFIIVGIAGLLVIVGVVMGVVLGLNRGNSIQQGDQSSTAGSAPNSEDDPVGYIEIVADCLTGEEYTVSERFKSIQSIIVSELPYMNDAIAAPGKSTRAALCWLAEVDSFDLDTTDESSDAIIQRFTLGLIYFHLVLNLDMRSDNQLPASNWLHSFHECQWDYVYCDEEEVVFELNLARLDLGGTLPSELSLLKKLSTLELDRNLLVGTIPSEMWTLESLETLNIELNFLTGTISSDIRKLPQLRNFLAQGNSFTGNLPDFAGLPNLRTLDLGLSDEVTGMFPSFEGTTNLESLGLGSLSLWGILPSHLGSLTKLTSLSLNHLIDLGGNIPTEIGMLTELRGLDFTNLFSISGSVPTELGQLTHLTNLNLYGMDGLAGTVPSEIGRLTNLRTLFLGGYLTGSIPAEVCNLRSQYSTELVEPCSGYGADCETVCPP